MFFEYSKALWMLLLLIPVLWVMRRSERKTVKIAEVFRGIPPEARHFRLKLLFVSVFIGSMVLVAARPYTESARSGDYIFLLDVSRSMDARQTCGDLTFLDRAKNVMRGVLKGIPEARFSIFVFDRFAFPVTQMTSNFDYLNEVIDEGIHIGMTFEATKTELANALEVVAAKRERLPQIYGKVENLVLLSDGFVGGDYRRRFAEPLTQLRNAGIRVMTVGIGNPGETPIMDAEGDRCINQHIEMDGEVVLIRLRDDILKFIAGESRGQYYSEGDVDGLIRDLREGLDTVVEGGEQESGKYRRDISIIFLTAASLSLFGLIVLGTNLRFRNRKSG